MSKLDELPAPSGMTWSVKQSFLTYLVSSGGVVLSDGGATVDDTGAGSWPVDDTSTFDIDMLEGRLAFTGRVRYSAHAGLLEVDITEPELVIADGMAELSSQGQRLGRFQVQREQGPAGYTVLVGHNGRLDPTALDLFGGVYDADTELDPLVVAIRTPEPLPPTSDGQRTNPD